MASLILFTFLVPLNFRIMFIWYDVIRGEGHVVLQLIITFLPLPLALCLSPLLSTQAQEDDFSEGGGEGGLQEYD